MGTLESLQKLFRYNLEGSGPVAQGGCGQIWKATDLLFNRPVAIKTITENLRWHATDAAARTFKKEAAAAARLGELSPQILRVIDLGIVDDTIFSVMDWIEPQQGFHTIDMNERSGRLSLSQTKAIIRQVCDAVAVAHQHGIVHSDIAPANIVFDPRAQLFKLADFGLLRIVEEWLVSHASGSLLHGGRLDFFPQEVKDSINNVGYASDVYALAVTLRVLLEGTACLPSLGGALIPTPGVIRIRHELRDAPDQVRQLLHRFLDGHTTDDRVPAFLSMLQMVPN
jgi:serine/threonine-protein kinase